MDTNRKSQLKWVVSVSFELEFAALGAKWLGGLVKADARREVQEGRQRTIFSMFKAAESFAPAFNTTSHGEAVQTFNVAVNLVVSGGAPAPVASARGAGAAADVGIAASREAGAADSGCGGGDSSGAAVLSAEVPVPAACGNRLRSVHRRLNRTGPPQT